MDTLFALDCDGVQKTELLYRDCYWVEMFAVNTLLSVNISLLRFVWFQNLNVSQTAYVESELHLAIVKKEHKQHQISPDTGGEKGEPSVIYFPLSKKLQVNYLNFPP